MTLESLGGGFDDIQDSAPSNPSIGDTWLDTSQDPPISKVYADLGSGGQWTTDLLDGPVSEAGSSQEVKTHDLRFIREMARLFFDRSLSELNFSSGDYEVFVDTNDITLTYPAPVIQTGANGSAMLAGKWDISALSATGTTLDVRPSYYPAGFEWKPDGTQLWIIGDSQTKIYEWNVSSAWDISTASHTGTTINTQDSSPSGGEWKPDGTQFWEIGRGSNQFYEYNVSSAWDISTASHTGTTLIAQDSDPTGFEWKPDGTQLWEIGWSKIYEYNVSTPWDISTASDTGTTINTQDNQSTGFAWKPDATQLWEVGRDSNKIYEYNVSSAWDISTASHTGTTINTQASEPSEIDWKSDATQLWVSEEDDYKIHEWKREGAPGSTLSTDISLSFTQTSVVVEDTTTGGLSVSYDIADGNGNTVTVTDGEIGTVVDTSVLTDGSLTVTVTLDSPNVSADDQLYDFALYFDQ
jgi:hypothetical protein